MGEAKRRRENAVPTVYHHTSTLRANQLWMTGVVEVEGKSEGVFHPKLGQILTDASLRRAMKDFPPVAWFTRGIDIPNVLLKASYFRVDKVTGERREITISNDVPNAVALNRWLLDFLSLKFRSCRSLNIADTRQTKARS